MRNNGHAIIKLIVLAAALAAPNAFGQLSQIQKAEVRDINILTNPGFENGKSKWTASGGTFTVTTTAANVGAGTTGGSWDASGAQTLTSAQATLPAGLYGQVCHVSTLYKGGDTNLTLQAIDGSSTVLASKVLNASTNFAVVGVDFICPTSGTAALRISAGANAAIAYFDQAFLGARAPPYVAGTAEINVIKNPSAKDNINDWYASGAGITVARSTTSSDLPVGDTAIKVTPVSSTDYVYTRWTNPASLQNRKLKVEWEQKALSGYASGDLKADVYCDDDSAYGSPTRQTLSTDSSSVTGVQNLTGRFTTTFDPDSTNIYCELRIVRTAGTTAVNFANVVVGPGIQPQGAVVGPWQTFTMSITGGGVAKGTNTEEALWRRVGDTMELSYAFRQTVAGSAGSGQYSFTLPLSLTLDTSKMAADGTRSVGRGFAYNGTTEYDADVVAGSSTALQLLIYTAANTTASLGSGNVSLGNSTARIFFFARVPIAEWSGSGTINLAQNDVEYAYNTSTSNANDTSSFGYGPIGTGFPSVATSAKTKRVRFSTPIQTTDLLTIEVSKDGSPWMPVELGGYENAVAALQYQNTNTYGMGFDLASISGTDVDVVFGIYSGASGATYAAAGGAWSGLNTYKWRVKKAVGGIAAGFGHATTEIYGLKKISKSMIYLTGGSGTGSGNTKVRRFTTVGTSTGTDITLAQDSTNGDSFTINTAGVYAIHVGDSMTSTNDCYIQKNSVTAAQSDSVTLASQRIAGNSFSVVSATAYLEAGDVVRWVVDNNATLASSAVFVWIRITKVD